MAQESTDFQIKKAFIHVGEAEIAAKRVLYNYSRNIEYKDLQTIIEELKQAKETLQQLI